MANITLLGASYTDVPAVDLPKTGGGTVRFYENGGSGYTRTVIAEEQTVTPATQGSQCLASLAQPHGILIAGDEYIITLNGDEYWYTCQNMWSTFNIIGDINYVWNGSDVQPYPCAIYDGNDFANLTLLTHNGNAGTPMTIKVEKIELTGGGGGGSSTLITKTVTANGTYIASDDDADGYDSVTVNVPSGASNIVTGTFKGTTTGAAMDVTLNYSGSGYPIAVMIYPSSANESTFQSTLQRYAVRDYVLEKDAKATSPTYSKTGNGDSATFTARYKNSSSSSASYANGGSVAPLYADEAARDAFNAIVKIRSKTKMSVFIASSSYGFMANIEYSYVVVYSS